MKNTLFKMFGFLRPYLPAYIPGMTVYSSQLFAFPFIEAMFMGMVMTAILEMNGAAAWRGVLVIAGIMVGYMAVLAVGTYHYMATTNKATRDLKAKLFRSFTKKSVELNTETHSGEGIAAINTDADTAHELYGNALNPFLSCVIAIVSSLTVVFITDFRLGLLGFAVGGVALFAQSRFAGPLSKIGKERLAVNAASVSVTSDLFSGGLAIRAFGLEAKKQRQFDTENKKLLTLNYRTAFIGMWQNLFMSVQGWLTLAIVFGFGGLLVANPDSGLTFPMLVFVLPMYNALAEGMAGIGGAWAGLQAPAAAAARVLRVIEESDYAQECVRMDIPTDGNYNLAIKDLNFTYKDSDSPALAGITLDIKENMMVAVVGASGSGKSTLLRVIAGMYGHGDIQLGDTRLDSVSADDWRRRFAYVDQHCALFDMTIGENIALGRAGEPVPDDVESAARRAHAHDFISEMPHGYGSPCGERGGNLSGGQKQRIAIARAIYRRASILVFDEATSALDGQTERSIIDTINDMRHDHTILLSTHNLETAVLADLVVVMDGGRIVQTGTHDMLLASPGVYRSLWSANSAQKEAFDAIHHS